MKQIKAIIKAYNDTAREYATQFIDELTGKPLDQLLLKRFADENNTKGKILDIACGPGQTTQFLHQCGVQNLLGLDLSPGMIKEAREIHQNKILFQTGDMLKLKFEDNHFGSAICFYGIVHFLIEELDQALMEIFRVIKPGGQFLFSFHIGNEISSRVEFLGKEVKMTFYYFEVNKVLDLLKHRGWKILEVIERHPYEGKEYPSKRAYILVEKS